MPVSSRSSRSRGTRELSDETRVSAKAVSAIAEVEATPPNYRLYRCGGERDGKNITTHVGHVAGTFVSSLGLEAELNMQSVSENIRKLSAHGAAAIRDCGLPWYNSS